MQISLFIFGPLWDALIGFGLGGQLVVAAVLVIAALEGWRILRTGRWIAGLLSTTVTYAIAALVATAAVISFGWIDPNPSAFLTDLAIWGGRVLEEIMGGVCPGCFG